MKKILTLIVMSLVLALSVSACGGSVKGASRNARKYNGFYTSVDGRSGREVGIIIQYPKAQICFAYKFGMYGQRTYVGTIELDDDGATIYPKQQFNDGRLKGSTMSAVKVKLSSNGNTLHTEWTDGNGPISLSFSRSDKGKDFLNAEYYYCNVTDDGEYDGHEVVKK